MVSEAAVLQALRAIRDPEAQQDIVALGLVRDVRITEADVSFTLAFTAQSPQAKATIHSMASRLVSQLPGVSRVQVKMSGGAREQPAAPAHGAGAAHGAGPVRSAELIPEVRHTVAVSSGKGGVGKSTVAVNLAVTLSQTGGTVGIIDSDVYGPDVPLMLGARGRPGMFENRIIPVEVHGLKMMSIGLLVNEREPLVWRGPMIHSFIQQMLRDVMWGALDYLVFDMPPGTGDAQLSLSQVIPLDGVVMVTTPQEVALLDVRKAIGMFQKLNVPLLGVVENMSHFVAPDTGRRYDIFGEGGGRRLAEEYGIPLLAQIPLDPETRVGGDEGSPIALRRPDSPQAKVFRDLALVKLRPGYEAAYAGKPAVHPVAGAGEIVSWERLASGRYNILLKGEHRVRIERERPSDTLYRVVTAQRLDDVPPAGNVVPVLDRIRGACGRLLRALDRPADLLDTALADGQPPGAIADRIAAAVLPDATLRQELLETLDVANRLARVSAALEDLVNELLGGRE